MPDDSPLDLARLDLIRARDRVAFKDTPEHRARVEEARATLDALLDTLPLTSSATPTPDDSSSPSPEAEPTQSPGTPGNPRGPGVPVSAPRWEWPSVGPSLADELMEMGQCGEDGAQSSEGER